MVFPTTVGRSSTSSFLLLRSSDFKAEKKQKSHGKDEKMKWYNPATMHGTRSGEYAGCFTVSMPNSLGVALATIEEWNGASPWY